MVWDSLFSPVIINILVIPRSTNRLGTNRKRFDAELSTCRRRANVHPRGLYGDKTKIVFPGKERLWGQQKNCGLGSTAAWLLHPEPG